MAKSREEWTKWVLSYTRGVEGADLEAILDSLIENPDQGVWHATATHFKRECFCQRCKPGIRYL